MSKLTLFVGLSLCLFYVICLLKVIFQLYFEHLWLPLLLSRLPAWLPREPSDLSVLKPGSFPWDWAYFELFWPPLNQFRLPAWPSREPSDLSGLKPDGPPLSFPLDSDSPPGPSYRFPLSSPWASFTGQSLVVHCLHCAYLMIVYSVTLFHSFRHYLNITLLYFWSWKCFPDIFLFYPENPEVRKTNCIASW